MSSGWKMIITLLLAPVLVILNGWVLSVIWGWFIVSIFGLQMLTIPHAIGLGMVVSFMTIHVEFYQDHENNFAMGMVFSFTRPFLTLLTAWIVKMFM